MTNLDPLEDGRQEFEVKLWEFVKANNCRTLDERVRVEQLVQLFGAAWTARAARERELLQEIDKWCSGENQVDDGEDAEHALRYIQDAIRAYLAGAALSDSQPQEGT